MNLCAIQVSCCLCEVKVLSIKALSNPNLWVKDRRRGELNYITGEQTCEVLLLLLLLFFAAVKP